MSEYQNINQKAILVVKQAAQFIQAEYGKIANNDIETKSLNSLVTYVDKASEKILVEGLQSILPQSTFLTEEETIERIDSEWQWIIDPLDGTTNFIHGIPVFAVSVALKHKEHIVCGIVYDVMQNNCFHATLNGGAFLNDNAIHVSETAQLADSLIATGFPYYDFDRMENYMAVLKDLINTTRGIRRLGAAAIDLAYVACGRFDTFFEYSLAPWDVAAGALLVKEAGGVITDFNGKNDWLFGKEIIATNQLLSETFIAKIDTAFNN